MAMLPVGDDLALALDRVRFAEAAGITPDNWQARLLRSPAPRILVNCSRQSGKSSTPGLLGAPTALYEPDAVGLVLSPTERQRKEVFLKRHAPYPSLDR